MFAIIVFQYTKANSQYYSNVFMTGKDEGGISYRCVRRHLSEIRPCVFDINIFFFFYKFIAEKIRFMKNVFFFSY